jgi:probable rRNA maturation factor
MIVQFVNQQRKFKVSAWKELLLRVLPAVLAAEPVSALLQDRAIDSQVTLTFVGPRQMRSVNRAARQVDRLTDVLSFPMLELQHGRLRRKLTAKDYLDPTAIPLAVSFGDILLSLDQAEAQAADYGHSLEREVAFLATHGMLHLLGYDHQTPAEERKMQARQRQVLQSLGLER